MPHSIEAVFYLAESSGDFTDIPADVVGPKSADYAIAAHATILEHFGLGHTDIPLLRLDLLNTTEPFSDHVDRE